MTKKTVIEHIAVALGAYKNCAKSGNREWEERWMERLKYIEKNHLPSGSGFDQGTTIDIEESKDNKIILYTSFHHMNEHGMYTAWTDHKITIRPTFTGIDIRITGPNRNEWKMFAEDEFYNCLMLAVELDFEP